MSCGCTRNTRLKFVWYNPQNSEGTDPVIYRTEVEARAKVMRMGGAYAPYDGTASIGVTIARAEAAKAAERASQGA